jgi:hypothetical protein
MGHSKSKVRIATVVIIRELQGPSTFRWCNLPFSEANRKARVDFLLESDLFPSGNQNFPKNQSNSNKPKRQKQNTEFQIVGC